MKRSSAIMAAAVGFLIVSQAAAETVTYETMWNVGATSGGVRGVEVDSSGNIYVVDLNANTVRQYTSSGALLNTFGSSNLKSPCDVAISSVDNSIYVSGASASNNYVNKFTSAGVYSSHWLQGATGTIVSLGITTDSSGNVYIGDTFGNTITEYSATGSTLATYSGAVGASGLALNASESIAYTASAGKLYATVLATNTMSVLATLSGADKYSIDVNTNTGNIYVAERGANVVEEFASDGTFIQKWNAFSAGSDVSYSTTSSFDGNIFGIAVNSATNMIYVTSQSGKLYSFQSVPEPGTLALMAGSLLGLIAYAWRRRR